MSTVLTSVPHWRCTLRGNLGIPWILAKRFYGGSVDVSAVDTKLPARSTPHGRSDQSAPSPRRATLRFLPDLLGPPHGGLKDMVRRRLRPTPTPSRLLHEGRDLLAGGCAYCTKAPPTWSTPNPPPVAPNLRALRPDDAWSHPNDCEQPGQSPTGEASNGNQDRSTRPTGALRCHDIRNSQKS